MDYSEITISFTPKPSETWVGAIWLFLHSPKRVMSHALLSVVCCLLSVVLGLALGFWAHEGLSPIYYALLFIATYWFVLFGVALARIQSRPGWRTKKTMKFSDDGVWVSMARVEGLLRWGRFGALLPMRKGFVLSFAMSKNFYWIPRSAFPTPQALSQWEADTESKLRGSKSSDSW